MLRQHGQQEGGVCEAGKEVGYAASLLLLPPPLVRWWKQERRSRAASLPRACVRACLHMHTRDTGNQGRAHARVRTFIFSSSFSHSTRLSSCTSCCWKASYVPHPNEVVRLFVDTLLLLYWSCGEGWG